MTWKLPAYCPTLTKINRIFSIAEIVQYKMLLEIVIKNVFEKLITSTSTSGEWLAKSERTTLLKSRNQEIPG